MKNLVKVITIGIFILFTFFLTVKSENIKVGLAQKFAIKVARLVYHCGVSLTTTY